MTEKNRPRISVVMPVFNSEKYLSSAIESILNQSYKNFEFIIIEDCSKDESRRIIEKYAREDKRIIMLRNEINLKMSKSLNKGIKVARGKYIARMDADDISFPYRLKSQYNFMESHPEVGILGGTMEIIDKYGRKISKREYALEDRLIRKKIFQYSPFSHPLIMIRKSIMDKAGYYDSIYNPAEDYELYFRIGSISKFANLPVELLRYRIVSNSMTTGDTKKMELKTIEIRKKYFKKYPYTPGTIDKIYNLLHEYSLYIIPSKFKMRIFHLLRNKA